MLYDEFLFHHNKTYTSKRDGSTVVYWQCERRRDLGCSTMLTSDVEGKVIKAPTVPHTHVVSTGRADALAVRHDILVESSRRPEAAPSALLNEFVGPEIALSLGSEPALKQAIQRRRRMVRPKDPDTASGIVISGDWAHTIDGQPWFMGEINVGDDSAYIFATEENLNKLNVSQKY